jgi:dTDP-4-dehydrorhamnose reductase
MRSNINTASGTILVTGANGQLGKELQQLAASCPQYDFVFLSREQLAIHHPREVRSAFKKYLPLYCINCAAYTAVDKAETEKELAFSINAEAAGVLAAVCKENNCQFIHISTDYVFEGTSNVPYREEAPVNPQSVYGASKLEGEKQALHHNPGTIIIRTSWVYSEFGKNFVKTMLRLMSEKEEISVVNDQYGSPTYAADLAETILEIIKQLPTHHTSSQGTKLQLTNAGIYHFSNEGVISWYDFAVAIKELSQSRCNINPIPTSAYPTPAKRPSWSVLNKTKIQETFGITIKGWKESLAACIQKINRARK